MNKTIEILKSVYGEDVSLEEILQKKINLEDQTVQKRFFSILKKVYSEQMPFNRLLGIKVDNLSMEKAIVSISMKDELIGNYEQKILHGGVISSIMDLTGGVIAQVNALRQMENYTIKDAISSFSKMSTIDMRVDFLRPGRGEQFICTGWIVRSGNKVAVTRMEVHNNDQNQIALGTGTYLVG